MFDDKQKEDFVYKEVKKARRLSAKSDDSDELPAGVPLSKPLINNDDTTS